MDSPSREIVNAYDELFIGITDRLPIVFFTDATPKNSHNIALKMFKYAIETRLNWSPTEVRDYLTMDIINDLKLSPVFRYIIFPQGLVPEHSLFYIAWLLYPQTKNKRMCDVDMETYHKFLNGTIIRLPKFYYTGENGLIRAYNCLIDRINYLRPFSGYNDFEKYEFFFTKDCVNFLCASRLLRVCFLLDITPAEYFSSSLNTEQKKFSLFSYFLFYKQLKLSKLHF